MNSKTMVIGTQKPRTKEREEDSDVARLALAVDTDDDDLPDILREYDYRK